ncbi:RidA family protein [Arthrobacter sp. NPDC057013]|uniref:RidA family protein n=1 Tax=Arthrobacter sp. NPDC057013 TaxID=3345999 RepID=UPI00363DA7F5
MAIIRTTSGSELPEGFPFSLASEANGVCFISGMPALDPDGKYREGSFEEETALAWHNVTMIARAAGFAVEEILYVQCVVADMADYNGLNAWWRQQFPDLSTAPARFTFQAGALPFGAKIEIQAVAGHGS